jgi:Spy/CpxP family protein refolding chaperone
MRTPLFALVFLALAPVARAQTHEGHGHAASEPAAAPTAPTALTDAEVAGLLDGGGLGMARPAEAHGYPGPLHVLELADALGLSPEQRAQTEAIRAAMLAEARALGAEVVEQERALDALFAQERATPALVDAVTAEIAALRGRLRAAHLRAHLTQRALLTPAQVEAYVQLRQTR